MKISVNKKGLITISPQGEDVVGIVKLLEEHYYHADIDMKYIQAKPVYYMREGAFYYGSKKIAVYDKNNKLDFVRKILNHFKVDYTEYYDADYLDYGYGDKSSNDKEFEKDKVYLNTFQDEDYIESCAVLMINGKQKLYFFFDNMDNGVDGQISELCRDLGCSFDWEYSRFPKGEVCKYCYSSDMHRFEQDGDIRGDCNVCEKVTTLYYR